MAGGGRGCLRQRLLRRDRRRGRARGRGPPRPPAAWPRAPPSPRAPAGRGRARGPARRRRPSGPLARLRRRDGRRPGGPGGDGRPSRRPGSRRRPPGPRRARRPSPRSGAHGGRATARADRAGDRPRRCGRWSPAPARPAAGPGRRGRPRRCAGDGLGLDRRAARGAASAATRTSSSRRVTRSRERRALGPRQLVVALERAQLVGPLLLLGPQARQALLGGEQHGEGRELVGQTGRALRAGRRRRDRSAAASACSSRAAASASTSRSARSSTSRARGRSPWARSAASRRAASSAWSPAAAVSRSWAAAAARTRARACAASRPCSHASCGRALVLLGRGGVESRPGRRRSRPRRPRRRAQPLAGSTGAGGRQVADSVGDRRGRRPRTGG